MPVWRPPPPMPSERPDPLPPVPQSEEEPLMAHDWGHLFRETAGTLIGGWMNPTPPPMPGWSPQTGMLPENGASPPVTPVTGGLGAESCEGMIWSGGAPPKGYKVVNACGVGVLRKVRRRRRRRLLTNSDKADISFIVATTGKGQLAASLIHRSAQ